MKPGILNVQRCKTPIHGHVNDGAVLIVDLVNL